MRTKYFKICMMTSLFLLSISLKFRFLYIDLHKRLNMAFNEVEKQQHYMAFNGVEKGKAK